MHVGLVRLFEACRQEMGHSRILYSPARLALLPKGSSRRLRGDYFGGAH